LDQTSHHSEAPEGNHIFTLTRSPYLNELIQSASVVYYEPNCPEMYLEPLKERLNVMKELTRRLSDIYQRQKLTQEQLPEILEQEALIETNLQELWKGLEKFDSLFSLFNREIILDALAHTKASTEILFYAFDRLNEQERRFDGYYSPSPYFNELIRITAGVMRGDFPSEALRERLEWMIGFWNHSFKEFTIYKTQKIDSPAVVERLPAIQQAYERCGEGLFQMMRFFEEGNMTFLSEGLDVVRESTIVLHESFQLIQTVLAEPSTVACFRCGASNEPAAKSCAFCQAIFPSYSAKDQPPALDLKVEDTIKSGSQRMITTTMQSLIEIVAAFNAERGDKQDLKNILELLWVKVQEGKMVVEKMPVPATMPTQEDRILLERSRSMTKEAALKLEQAIQEMSHFFEDDELMHLREGLEIALTANDMVVEVQTIGRDMWEKYKPAQDSSMTDETRKA
jgi:hypothetical protein